MNCGRFLSGRRNECSGSSMYLAKRSDIRDAREAAALFPETWWGIVVFTCFGALKSTRLLRDVAAEPVLPEAIEKLLEIVQFTHPMVGHHRIQPALLGAKTALTEACRRSDFLHEVLCMSGSFNDRYRRLREAKLPQWGRTTCFDLLLRSGTLGVFNQFYAPELAYLAESTGPRIGFRIVWGQDVTNRNAPCARVSCRLGMTIGPTSSIELAPIGQDRRMPPVTWRMPYVFTRKAGT